MGKEITERQKRFADCIVAGNCPEEALCQAGYNVKTAKKYSRILLKKKEIAAYIEEAFRQEKVLTVADTDEISAFWTAVMRDPEEDIKNRIKASELLAKRGDCELSEGSSENPFAGLSTVQLEYYLTLLTEK